MSQIVMRTFFKRCNIAESKLPSEVKFWHEMTSKLFFIKGTSDEKYLLLGNSLISANMMMIIKNTLNISR